MPRMDLTTSGTFAGLTIASRLQRTTAGQIGHGVTLSAATAGTVASHDAGPPEQWTLNLPDHGLATNDIVDVYWDGGRRYGVKVVGVAGDDVTVEDGADAGGDSIPTALGTAVTVAEQQLIDTDFDGDLVVAIGALCRARAHVGFFNSAGNLALSLDLAAEELWQWLSGGSTTNPLAGETIDYVAVTQADSSATAEFRLGILYDSTV